MTIDWTNDDTINEVTCMLAGLPHPDAILGSQARKEPIMTMYDEYLTTLVCQVCDAADMARADLSIGPLDDESIARMQAYIDAAEEEHSCPVK